MIKKMNQLNVITVRNYFLMIISILFVFILSNQQLIAQTTEVIDSGHAVLISSPNADSCQEWQSISVKVSDSKVNLSPATTQDGQIILRWTNPDGKNVKLDIYKAKGLVNIQGQIEVCSFGKALMFFKDSITLSKLKNDVKLLPGYYAMRVIVGYSNDRYVGTRGESSDWISIQIK
jgi:hypothetical protein